jgi:MFS family permease
VVVERLSTLMLLQAAVAAIYLIFMPRTFVFAIMGVLLVVSLAAAVGLRQLQPWGRVLGILHSAVTLLGFPVGTVLGGALLVYFFKPEVQAAFSSDPSTRHLAAQATNLWRPLSIVIGVLNIFVVLALAAVAVAVLVPRYLAR